MVVVVVVGLFSLSDSASSSPSLLVVVLGRWWLCGVRNLGCSVVAVVVALRLAGGEVSVLLSDSVCSGGGKLRGGWDLRVERRRGGVWVAEESLSVVFIEEE